jgi:hypothetical protein
MSVKFIESTHSYISVNPDEDIKWISVTSFISKFKKKFEADKVALKCSKNKKSKWYGLEPKEIIDIWNKEAKRATDLGTFYHNEREKDLLAVDTLRIEDKDLSIIKPIIVDGIKHAPEQKLEEGVYPEHFVYLKSIGLCGQADYIEVVNGKVNILDFKTNKEIKTESFVNWEGFSDKMSAPLHHLDDCNMNHYNIQMSLYLYMILKHNPNLKPGKLTIRHVQFKTSGEDEYGYPLMLLDDNNNPVVDNIVDYELPYLKPEVNNLIKTLK